MHQVRPGLLAADQQAYLHVASSCKSALFPFKLSVYQYMFLGLCDYFVAGLSLVDLLLVVFFSMSQLHLPQPVFASTS